MLQISTADILKIVLPTVITLFIAVVKTPFRIRRENHDKLLNLLESVEKPQSAPIRLLRFRDYIGNRSAGLVALQGGVVQLRLGNVGHRRLRTLTQ